MITISNLSFGFKKRHPLFVDLSTQMQPGSIVGILGKNGAGKTTLLKILSGLRFPGSGSVDVMGFSPKIRSPLFYQALFLIPEEFQVPDLTIQTFHTLYSPFYPTFDSGQFDRHCEEFELPTDVKTGSLSMGQRKKLLIAFGLAANTPLLLMDEPTNGLDIPSKSRFRKMVAAALSEERLILIATHQVRDVESLIDSVLILDNGRVLFHQPLNIIGSRLKFSLEPDIPCSDSIYSEKTLEGNLTITANQSGTESPVFLEPLFNAVTDNRQALERLFKEDTHET